MVFQKIGLFLLGNVTGYIAAKQLMIKTSVIKQEIVDVKIERLALNLQRSNNKLFEDLEEFYTDCSLCDDSDRFPDNQMIQKYGGDPREVKIKFSN